MCAEDGYRGGVEYGSRGRLDVEGKVFSRRSTANPCRAANPPERHAPTSSLRLPTTSHRQLSSTKIALSHPPSLAPPPTPPSATATMAQPVVQTIHRDPALLCVPRTALAARIHTDVSQLVDSTPHHRGHGMRSRHGLKDVPLMAGPDSDGHPPPLRHDTPPDRAQEADAPADSAAASARARHQSANKCKCIVADLFPS